MEICFFHYDRKDFFFLFLFLFCFSRKHNQDDKRSIMHALNISPIQNIEINFPNKDDETSIVHALNISLIRNIEINFPKLSMKTLAFYHGISGRLEKYVY